MLLQPVTEGNYYHICNRGVNSEDIFKEEKNYGYFLQQYKKYCGEVFNTYAFALLKNHFHLLVYVKENVTTPLAEGDGSMQLNASNQLSHFFNSYAQSINKAYNRTGPLFESPFERRLIGDDNYFTSMIFNCHYNPQLHGMVKDFRDWPHTSYHQIINNNSNVVDVRKTTDWFGSADAFTKQHEGRCTGDGIYIDVSQQHQPPAGLKPAAGVLARI